MQRDIDLHASVAGFIQPLNLAISVVELNAHDHSQKKN